MSTLAQFDVSDFDDSLFERLPKAAPQDVQPNSVAASLQAPKSEDALFEGLPKSPAPTLQKAVTRNPDTVAGAVRIAKEKGVSVDLVERNYVQMSAQEKAEKNQRVLEAMGAGGTADFMLNPTNAGMAHDDVENLVRVEQESNVFRALGKVSGRAVPKVFQFYNQSLAYFSGTLDSAAKTAEELTGFKRGGVFKQAEQHYLAQSKYINDEVLNSELLKLPEHVTKSLWENPQLLMNPEYLVTQVGEAASSMLPMMAAYVVSGGSLAVPSVIGGLQEASSLYEDLVRDGVDQESASMAATSFGVVVGLLNKVGLEELTKKIPTKTIMQNLTRRGAAGAAEGFTEYLEEPFQAAFSALAKGKSMDGVVQDVVASFKNVDVIPGAFLLGASGAVSGTAKRVENSALAAMKATQNGAQLAALSKAVASSKLGQRAPEKLGEFIDSVLPEEAKEQFIDAQQFATVFQESISKEDGEGLDIASPDEVLSRLEVSPEAFQEALQKDTVMPLSVPTLMQNLTKDERELILPHIKKTPLSMSEAESVQLDLHGEASRVFSEYSQDEEYKTALEAERTRIVDGLIKQGVHEEDARVMAAIPYAFAQSHEMYGLDGVDFLRRIHVGEVGAHSDTSQNDYSGMNTSIMERVQTPYGEVNALLYQAAKKVMRDKTGRIEFEYEDTGVEFDPYDREKMIAFFKSLEAEGVTQLRYDNPEAYNVKLANIVENLFPEGVSLKEHPETGEPFYDYFTKKQGREKYLHTIDRTLKNSDVKVIASRKDGEKILFIKRYFDEELAKDIWDILVEYNGLVQTKWYVSRNKGAKEAARAVVNESRDVEEENGAGYGVSQSGNRKGGTESTSTQSSYVNNSFGEEPSFVNKIETKKAQQDTEQTAAELGVSQTTSLEGNTESTSPQQFDYRKDVSSGVDEVNTTLFQAAKKAIFDETGTIKFEYEDTGVEFDPSDRAKLREYFKSLEPAKIKALKLESKDAYVAKLKEIVDTLFPEGLSLKINDATGEFDYEYFLKQSKRQKYIHTFNKTLRQPDVTITVSKADGDKVLYLKHFFDQEVEKDVWDTAVCFNEKVQTKWPTLKNKGVQDWARTISLETTKARQNKKKTPLIAQEGTGVETGVSQRTIRDGNNESTSTQREYVNDNISDATDEVKTELNQGQRGSLSFLPDNNYLIKLAATADRSTFVHECAHVFLAELSRMTGQTQVFDQNVSSPKLDDLAAEQEMLGEAMNAGLEDSLSAINPEGKPYAEVNPEWAGKEEGYRTATIQKDFDDALHNNDDAYQAEKAKLAQVVESKATDIPPQLLKDMAVLRKWMKLKEGDSITTVHHEQFARGFEAYLREGKAPSNELAQVFHRFRKWLLSIYKNAKSLHVNLNDEVRDVFDRMLATSEQTSELMYEELSQLTPSNLSEHVELDEYDRRELERCQIEAERQTTASMDRATLRERNKRWREAREQAREVVENEPVYQAILWMSKRTGLDEAYMLEYYGKDSVKALRQKHRGLIKKDGQDGDDIATEFGYDDSDSMVYAMVDAPSFKDRVEQLAEDFVKAEDEQLIDEYGTTLAGEARGEYLEKLHAAEVKKRRGITYTPREFLRKVIQGNTPFTTVRDAMRYDMHQHTIRKHLKLREEVFAKGQNTPLTDLDYRKASFHLDKIRMGYEMIGEAVRVREEAAKIVARAKKFAKSKSIETHFSDHICVLVQRFKMGGKSLVPKNPDHMSSLKTLIESQNDIMETAPSFSEWLIEGNESVDWKDLSVGELRELNDLLSFLDHHGREQTKENERISKERLDNTADVTTRGAEGRKRKKWEYGTIMRKVMDAKDKIFASLDTLQYLLATFDEVNDTGKNGERGANIKMIFDELVKAQNVQSQMWHDMQFKIRPALSHLRKTARRWEKQHGKSFVRIKLTDELRKQIGEGVNVGLADQEYLELPVPELMQQDSRKWTADSIIGLMLHTGTASNLERVYAGYPELKENNVLMYLKSMLTHEDWDAIQQIWDAVDTLYPEVDRVHKQLNGFHMSKTEALPFGIERNGKIKKYQGGYFPAVYDSTLPQTHFIKQQVELDEAISRAEAINQTPAARSGFTKGRKAKAPGFPLKLSVNVAVEHLYDTIHYTTHAEVLRFADRLTRHKKWEKAFTEVMGSAAYDAVRGHLKSIARPEKPITGIEQTVAEKLRVAATPFILGWNFGVAAKQVFSLPGGVHDIGMKEFCKGLKTVMSMNPRKQMKWIHEVSPYMRDRASSMDRELADMANKFRMDVRTIEVFGKELSHQDAVDLGFWPIRMADMATTYVLWVSAYEKAMRQGQDMEQAVFYADDIIRKSQPSSQAIDQTMWQRHQGALRMFSMFQTYTVRTFGARQRHHFRAMKAGKMSKVEYAKYVLYDQIFPPIAMQLAFALLWGNAPDPDDDEAILDFLLEMGEGTAMYQFAGIPLVSSVFSAFDADRMPAATGLILIQRALRTGWAFLENPDDKQTERMLWSLFHLGSYVTRVPASQVARRFKKGMEQLEDGEGTPVNPLIPEPKK